MSQPISIGTPLDLEARFGHLIPDDYVSPEQAEQVAGFLGKPDSSTIVPKGSLATLMDIAEGLPTYDHE